MGAAIEEGIEMTQTIPVARTTISPVPARPEETTSLYQAMMRGCVADARTVAKVICSANI
jgi:hypothetical protein